MRGSTKMSALLVTKSVVAMLHCNAASRGNISLSVLRLHNSVTDLIHLFD